MADAWPTTNIVTTDMDAGSDNAGVARADIKLMADAVNDMMGQPPMGSGINVQTGTTYTVATTDNGKIVVGNHAANITITLIAAGTAGAQYSNTILAGNATGKVTITGTVGPYVNPVLYPGDSLVYFTDGTSLFGYIIPSSLSGSFTPTYQDLSLSDAEGQTYITQKGSYVRYGKLCYVNGTCTINSLGTLTTGNQTMMANFPFPAKNSANNGSGIKITTAASLALPAGGQSVAGIFDQNSTTISLVKWSAASGITTFTIANLSSLGKLSFDGWYEME